MFPDVFLDFVLLKIQLPQYADPKFPLRSGLSLPLWMSCLSLSFVPQQRGAGGDDSGSPRVPELPLNFTPLRGATYFAAAL